MVPLEKIVGGALGAFSAAEKAARHVAWLLNHHVHGAPR
jgi:hypothetical protein